MNWNGLSTPHVPDDAPRKLRKERDRIAKLIGQVPELRAKADELEKVASHEYQADKTCDRRAFFGAIIAALEAEERIRAALEPVIGACNELRQRDYSAARDSLHQIVQRTRAELGIPDGQPNPFAALQCKPEWHAARAKVAATAGHDDGGLRANGDALRAVRSELDHFRGCLKAQERLQATKAKERERAARRAAEDAERAQERVAEREDPVEALLAD